MRDIVLEDIVNGFGRRPWVGNPGGQLAFLSDQTSEVKAGKAGKRSGKTHSAVRDHAIKRMRQKRAACSTHSRPLYLPGLIVVPTLKDWKTTVWPSLLEAATEAQLRPVWRAQDAVVLFTRLRSSYGVWGCAYSNVRSCEAPAAIDNFEVADLLFEEFGHIKERPDDLGNDPVALSTIRVSLEGPCTQRVYIGTPTDGPGNPMDRWFESCEAHTDNKLPAGWAVYEWSTEENQANLPADYIERTKRGLAAYMVEAVLHGRTARPNTSLAYFQFDDALHLDASLVYMPALPVLVTLDWNVEPMVWVISQFRGKGVNTELFVLDEIVMDTNGNVDEGADALFAWLDRHGHTGELHVHGDPSGDERNLLTHDTAAKRLKDRLRKRVKDQLRWRLRRGASSQADRLEKMNAMFLTADGRRHVITNPKTCVYTVRDWRQVKTKPDGSIVKETTGPGKLLTHASDGLAEFAYDIWPDPGETLEGRASHPMLNQQRKRAKELIRG